MQNGGSHSFSAPRQLGLPTETWTVVLLAFVASYIIVWQLLLLGELDMSEQDKNLLCDFLIDHHVFALEDAD